ncbi:hypothetical protein WC434_13625, partial [Bordetella avium]|uniref:hypothetical protein n=1 Tax=Bordetella avium TaxID=521 RepID=UPI00307F9009
PHTRSRLTRGGALAGARQPQDQVGGKARVVLMGRKAEADLRSRWKALPQSSFPDRHRRSTGADKRKASD